MFGTMSTGRFGGRLSAAVLLTVVTYTTWYTALTLAITGTFTPVKTVADPYTQYQLNTTTSNTFNQFYGTNRMQDATGFVMSFDVYIDSAALADALFWYCGATSLPTNETTLFGATAVVLQVYNASSTYPGRGMYLVRGAASGTTPTGATTGGTTGGTLGSNKTMTICNSLWKTVVITYQRSPTNTWSVTYDGSFPITVSDTDVSTWRGATGSYWGIAGRTGGSAGNFYVRRLQLTTQN